MKDGPRLAWLAHVVGLVYLAAVAFAFGFGAAAGLGLMFSPYGLVNAFGTIIFAVSCAFFLLYAWPIFLRPTPMAWTLSVALISLSLGLVFVAALVGSNDHAFRGLVGGAGWVYFLPLPVGVLVLMGWSRRDVRARFGRGR